MDALVSVDSTTKKVTILPGIKDFGINTYQFLITCKDDWSDSIVNIPFRIVVFDSLNSTVVDP